MKAINEALLSLIEAGNMLKLNEQDIKIAKDFYNHHEFGLAFDTIVTQMYEYDIEIDDEFYMLVEVIGKTMNLNNESYTFMKELIRSESTVPKPVKEQLAKIVSNLKS